MEARMEIMKKWLEANEGKDLINTVHNFKEIFSVTDEETYKIWQSLGYV